MMRYFETIKCLDGKALNLEYHKKRVFSTIGKNLELNITPPNNELYRCKVIYNKDKIENISFYPYKKKEIKNFKLVFDNDIEYSFKYLNRDCFNKYNYLLEEYDELIFVKDGLITDTTIANIAIFLNNTWLTPAKPLLLGTSRQRYIDQGILIQKDITVDMLKAASSIATLNAMVDFNQLKFKEPFLF